VLRADWISVGEGVRTAIAIETSVRGSEMAVAGHLKSDVHGEVNVKHDRRRETTDPTETG
jgi:hypothetical protein